MANLSGTGRLSYANEAVDDLALTNGDSVSAIVKASEVIVGKG